MGKERGYHPSWIHPRRRLMRRPWQWWISRGIWLLAERRHSEMAMVPPPPKGWKADCAGMPPFASEVETSVVRWLHHPHSPADPGREIVAGGEVPNELIPPCPYWTSRTGSPNDSPQCRGDQGTISVERRRLVVASTPVEPCGVEPTRVVERTPAASWSGGDG